VPGFHFNEARTGGVAFNCKAWFDADGSKNAVEVTMKPGVFPAADSDEWFGGDLLQGDGFLTSERVRSSQRDTQRVGAEQFKLDACGLRAFELEYDRRSRFEPHRVALEDANGKVIEELVQPRSSFQGHTLETPWSDLQLAYFVGTAM
jgi:hypothetical protein